MENLNRSKYIIIRPAAVYGEGDKAIGKRVVKFLESSPFIVHFGKWKGKNCWPLADVKNVAKVIYITSACSKFDGEAINTIDEKITTAEEYYRLIAKEYFPQNFKTITLPLWLGKTIGLMSTTVSNMLGKTHAIFDPTYYSVHHVSSNLDFSSKNQNLMLEKYELLVKEYSD